MNAIGGLVCAEWWHRNDVVGALYRWVVDHGQLDGTDTEAVQRFITAPWDWADAYREMKTKARN